LDVKNAKKHNTSQTVVKTAIFAATSINVMRHLCAHVHRTLVKAIYEPEQAVAV